jgi:hypothetical protein
MAQILESVDATKKEKFNQKYTRLSEEDWTRDNFESRMSEVLNAIDNIEDFITGLQDEIDSIRGDKPGVDSDFEQIKEGWNDASARSFDDLQSTSMAGGFNPTLKSLLEKRKQLADRLQKINEWKTFQGELSRLAMKRLFRISQGYKEEFVTAEVREKFEEYAEQLMEEKVDRMKQEIKQDFTRQVADLEQATNAARNEIKNAWTFMETFADKVNDEELYLISQESVDQGLQQFVTEAGTMDLSGERLKVEDEQDEREEARESAVEESFEQEDESESEETEPEREQNDDLTAREELLEGWDGYYRMLSSKKQIADELDVSAPYVTKIMDEEGLELE